MEHKPERMEQQPATAAARAQAEVAVQHKPATMVSIWFFVSLVLGVYGLIVTAAGVRQALFPSPPTSVLGETNPSLWWGCIMLAAAIALFLLDRLAARSGR